jgi:hypothetical protein
MVGGTRKLQLPVWVFTADLFHPNDHAHLLFFLQLPEQHCAGLAQALFLARHVAACVGVGVRIEVTNGIAIAAPMPIRLTASRRVKRCIAASHSKGSSSK